MDCFEIYRRITTKATQHRTVLFKKFSQISLKKSAKITLFNSTNQIPEYRIMNKEYRISKVVSLQD